MCFQKDDWRICVLAIFNSPRQAGSSMFAVNFHKSPYFIGSLPFWLSKSKAVFSIWPQRNCCVGIGCSLQWTEKRLQFRLRDYQKTFHIKSGKNISLKFKLHGLVVQINQRNQIICQMWPSVYTLQRSVTLKSFSFTIYSVSQYEFFPKIAFV